METTQKHVSIKNFLIIVHNPVKLPGHVNISISEQTTEHTKMT